MSLDQPIDPAGARRAATLLCAAAFDAPPEALAGRTPRQIAWTLGGTSERRRKLALELLDLTLEPT
jgi:hypothetical protein